MKTVAKTAGLLSTISTNLLLAMSVTFFLLILSLGISLWLGALLGKSHYGFLIVAGFYALAGLILLLIRPYLRSLFTDAVIRKLLN